MKKYWINLGSVTAALQWQILEKFIIILEINAVLTSVFHLGKEVSSAIENVHLSMWKSV